jgi:hypothetical protein
MGIKDQPEHPLFIVGDMVYDDIMLPLSEVMLFIDWVSNKKFSRCTNGEWIQNGTGEYKTVAQNTIELYELYKNSGE